MAHAIVEFDMAVKSMEKMSHCDRVTVKYNLPFWKALIWFCCGKPRGTDEETQSVKSQNKKDPWSIEWTLTHSYFANMGGFHLFVDADKFPHKDSCQYTKTNESPGESESANKNKSADDNKSADENKSLSKDELADDMHEIMDKYFFSTDKYERVYGISPLTTAQLANCWDYIEKFQLEEKEIKDRSKGDFFTKTVALFQISSLLFSVIVRSVRHLDICQLELVTLAFVACGVLTYICWYKPQSIETVTKIWLSDSIMNPNLRDPWQTIRELRIPKYDKFWQILTSTEKNAEPNDPWRIPNDNIPRANTKNIRVWNFEFPTPIERSLWRVAALISVCIPPITLIILPLIQLRMKRGDVQGFMSACLFAMRRFDDRELDESLKRLEELYGRPENIDEKHYMDVFEGSEPEKLKELHGFISERDSDFPFGFSKQFESLLQEFVVTPNPNLRKQHTLLFGAPKYNRTGIHSSQKNANLSLQDYLGGRYSKCTMIVCSSASHQPKGAERSGCVGNKVGHSGYALEEAVQHSTPDPLDYLCYRPFCDQNTASHFGVLKSGLCIGGQRDIIDRGPMGNNLGIQNDKEGVAEPAAALELVLLTVVPAAGTMLKLGEG
ncbi:hypothetical protein AOQ84DRAFT_377310 [Glonium stellatum]|uniref:Uncharacterized protein n=1 Tax=Glonium stellatum TaxID=574774 RepID=A0A8E2F041_9PEZI|nr:hypothetical protein AOQ84DRAFT_377310 [Glonium stellatum]